MKVSIEGWRKWSLGMVGLIMYGVLLNAHPDLPVLELALGVGAMVTPQMIGDVLKARAQNGVKQ